MNQGILSETFYVGYGFGLCRIWVEFMAKTNNQMKYSWIKKNKKNKKESNIKPW